MKIRRFVHLSIYFVLTTVSITSFARGDDHDEWFRNWKLEQTVRQANLILVARVSNVSKVTLIEGAKTSTALREYRFQPIQVLKGIFGRPELAMTGSDLGCPVQYVVGDPPIQQGEFRLLLLSQRRGSIGCVGVNTGPFEATVPHLTGLDDPIVSAVQTMVRLSEKRTREDRAKLVLKALDDVDGPAAVSLLDSLWQRAIAASQLEGVAAPLTRLASSKSPSVRYAAIETIRAILWGEYTDSKDQLRKSVAPILRETLDDLTTPAHVRVSALKAMGHLGSVGHQMGWPAEILLDRFKNAKTFLERNAALYSLCELEDPKSVAAIANLVTGLPLDAHQDLRRRAYVFMGRHSPQVAAKAVMSRLDRLILAEMDCRLEVSFLAALDAAEAVPLLLRVASSNTPTSSEKAVVALALGYLESEEGIPILSHWAKHDASLHHSAVLALCRMGTKAAATELRPMLKTEPALAQKLEIAALLGRHKIDDGYSLAMEHLADREYTIQAAKALAEIAHPQSNDTLHRILANHPDQDWLVGALAGLTALGDKPGRKQLYGLLKANNHPALARLAAIAVLSDRVEFQQRLAELANSRGGLAKQTLQSLRQSVQVINERRDDVIFFQHLLRGEWPPETKQLDAKVAKTVQEIVLDALTNESIRASALDVLQLANRDLYESTLLEIVNQPELEGRDLLSKAEHQLRRLPHANPPKLAKVNSER